MNNKTYDIDSFEKLMNVISDENFERLTLDMIEWMAVYLSYIKEIKAKYPKKTKGKLNWELCQAGFQWIDDGKHDLKYVELHNKQTGEITRLKESK